MRQPKACKQVKSREQATLNCRTFLQSERRVWYEWRVTWEAALTSAQANRVRLLLSRLSYSLFSSCLPPSLTTSPPTILLVEPPFFPAPAPAANLPHKEKNQYSGGKNKNKCANEYAHLAAKLLHLFIPHNRPFSFGVHESIPILHTTFTQ